MKRKSDSHWLLGVFAFFSFLALVFVSLALWKNYTALQQVKQNQSTTITSVSYSCDNNKTIQAVYLNNNVELNLSDGRGLMLTQGVSGSGVRYINDNESITFWNKGNTAFVEEGPDQTVTYQNCVGSSK